MNLIFLALWLMRTVKADLFWLYLIQLKEYRLDRLRDHLKTGKGASIVINYLMGVKLALFFALAAAILFSPSGGPGAQIVHIVLFSIPAIYLAESADALRKLKNNSLKVPKPSGKAKILTAVAIFSDLIIVALALNIGFTQLAFYLLAVDLK
jgi:hypothetical protein